MTPPTVPVTPVITPPVPGRMLFTTPPSVAPVPVTSEPTFGRGRLSSSPACAGDAANAVPALSAPTVRSAVTRRERSVGIWSIRPEGCIP
jgi:hypothetical protein